MKKNKSLRKLTVFVTEKCNLQCEYCYVKRSDQHLSKEWSSATAAEVVDGFLCGYRSCDLIQFFGGEPSLRLGVIRSILERVAQRVQDGELSKRPRFALVSNGVFTNREQTINLIQKWDMEVTISLDGPRQIHDVLRPKTKGRTGSFNDAINTIRGLRELGLPFSIESVYTSHHIKNHVSVSDIIDFAYKLRAKSLFLDPAYPPAPSSLVPFNGDFFGDLVRQYEEAVDYWFHSTFFRDEFVLRMYFADILAALLRGEPANRSLACPAGTFDAAIDSKGRVYPCSLFYGYRNFSYTSEQYLPQARDLDWLHNDTWPPEECRQCEFRFWCRICPAMNLRWGDIHRPEPKECYLHKSVVKRLAQNAFRYLLVPSNEITEPLRSKVT